MFLVSIFPQHVAHMRCQRKRWELRRSKPPVKTADVVAVYETVPVGRVTALFAVGDVLAMSPPRLKAVVCNDVPASDLAAWDDYFAGRTMGWAVEVTDFCDVAGPSLAQLRAQSVHPPQGWIRFDASWIRFDASF